MPTSHRKPGAVPGLELSPDSEAYAPNPYFRLHCLVLGVWSWPSLGRDVAKAAAPPSPWLATSRKGILQATALCPQSKRPHPGLLWQSAFSTAKSPGIRGCIPASHSWNDLFPAVLLRHSLISPSLSFPICKSSPITHLAQWFPNSFRQGQHD